MLGARQLFRKVWFCSVTLCHVEETTRLWEVHEKFARDYWWLSAEKSDEESRNNLPRPKECLTDGCVDPSGRETQGLLCERRSCLCQPWKPRFCRWSTSCTCGSREDNEDEQGLAHALYVACYLLISKSLNSCSSTSIVSDNWMDQLKCRFLLLLHISWISSLPKRKASKYINSARKWLLLPMTSTHTFKFGNLGAEIGKLVKMAVKNWQN